MRKSLVCIFYLLIASKIFGQNKVIDSIKMLINKASSDTQRINLKLEQLRLLGSHNLDSAIVFGLNLVSETKKINYKYGEAIASVRLASNFNFTGKFDESKKYLDNAKDILLPMNDSMALTRMYNIYGTMYSMQNKFDSSHPYFNKSIEMARLLKDKNLLGTALQNNAIAFQQESNYPQALAAYQEALNTSEEINDEDGEAYIYVNIAITYVSLDEKKRAEESYLKAIALAKKLTLNNVMAYSYSNLASLYNDLKNYPKEYESAMKAALLGKEMGDRGIQSSSLSRAAQALVDQNKPEEAKKISLLAISIADSSKEPLNIFQTNTSLGYILYLEKKYADAIPYFEKAIHFISESDLYNAEVRKSYADLSECYEKTGKFDKALAAFKISSKISDTISRKENIKKATELTLNYEFAQKQQIVKDEQQKKNDLAKATQKGLIIGLILTFILGAVALNGFRNKRKSNILLQQKNVEIETTLSELKAAQAQLIQSEKMASLGELTAGIAHEIQNPLNFVNNFSEVNKEMLEELKAERLKPGEEKDEHLQNEIINDVINNEEKINYHGKRADAIVKGMLQHSRSSSIAKEPTDINALADEYLRLAYHGLRAKDNTFNATMKTDFDKTINKINIVPQDIARVLLNLYTNAFYSVNEKQKLVDKSYRPEVSVQTKKINNNVEIKVSDNGSGIPQNIINKIFQPFFTTKPPGQGTGLGLSLSYDIIKAHGGEIKVSTKENEGTEFVILMPL